MFRVVFNVSVFPQLHQVSVAPWGSSAGHAGLELWQAGPSSPDLGLLGTGCSLSAALGHQGSPEMVQLLRTKLI